MCRVQVSRGKGSEYGFQKSAAKVMLVYKAV